MEGGSSAVDLFTGTTVAWGFAAKDIFTNSMFLISTLAGFILLGVAIRYVPSIIAMFRNAVAPGGRK